MSEPTLIDQLLDSWRIHHRVNLYLLDAVADEALGDVGPTKGRSVAKTFAHLHNVRLMWIGSAAPELLERLEKLADDAPGRDRLRASLDASAAVMEAVLARGLETGKIRGFKPHPAAFLGYLISHESHHRGQVTLALKAAGHLPEKTVRFGLWEWGVR